MIDFTIFYYSFDFFLSLVCSIFFTGNLSACVSCVITIVILFLFHFIFVAFCIFYYFRSSASLIDRGKYQFIIESENAIATHLLTSFSFHSHCSHIELLQPPKEQKTYKKVSEKSSEKSLWIYNVTCSIFEFLPEKFSAFFPLYFCPFIGATQSGFGLCRIK
jgi:hypothetical protein